MQLNQLANNDDFNSLVEDVKGIFEVARETVQTIGFKTLYSVGKRINQETDFTNKYGKKIVPLLAKSTGISSRGIYRAIKFEKKLKKENFANVEEYLNNRPLNWTVSKEYKLLDGIKPCLHEETEEKVFLICKDCGKLIK